MPLAATFGLSQRERLQSSSENAYRIALERMFRSRLIFRLEELLEANRNNPGFVYEALKVYMMLGGLQPVDRELVLAMDAARLGRQSLSRRRQCGGPQGAGGASRRDARSGGGPRAADHAARAADRGDAEDARAAERRAARLRAAANRRRAPSRAGDWVAGAQAAARTSRWCSSAAGGEDLESVRVPELLHLCGLPSRLRRTGSATSPSRCKRSAGCSGAAGEQTAVPAQYDTLGQDLLDLYARDFIAAWRDALGRLQLQPLTADKPKYVALGAVAARDLAAQADAGIDPRRDRADARAAGLRASRPAAAARQRRRRHAAAPSLLQPQDRAPGAAHRGGVQGFHVLVEGDATRRPIDEIIANLNEIHQNLTLLATNPAQAAQANAALQTQVASLRANATALPPPFADMLLQRGRRSSKAI